ncbi:MAG: hypothetical protein PVF20_08120, partial [Desulfobacterales bacterium]
MISGRESMHEINQHIQRAHTELESTTGRMEDLNRELTSIRVETAEHFRRLARYRLDDLQADRMIGQLDEIDRNALALLDNHRNQKSALVKEIDDSKERQKALEARRKALQEERDAAGEALEDRLSELHSRVSETEAYRQQKERAEQAGAVARNADEKATKSESDRAEKGRPYKADSLFTYLWERRYLTPDYRANPIARLLDGWVARLIDFRKARANYHMLLELPERLRDHATKTGQTAELEFQALEQMEREAAQADGIPDLQKGLDRLEADIHALDEDIDKEEARHGELLEARESLDAGGDGYSKQAFELILSELQREELTELYRQAKSTPRLEDDAIVARIGQFRERVGHLEADIRDATLAVSERRKALAELEEVRRRFRRKSYDAYDSGFSSDLGLSVLLGQVLGGMMGSDRAWEKIGRNHRRRGGFGGFGGPSRGGWGGFGGGSGGGGG